MSQLLTPMHEIRIIIGTKLDIGNIDSWVNMIVEE